MSNADEMLKRVTAIEFIRRARSGRTKPAFATCGTDEGDTIELVLKFTAGCDQGGANLAFEAIGGCLAGHLGLPIPEPFVVDIPGDLVATVPDTDLQQFLQRSVPIAFGSKYVKGYSAWGSGSSLTDAMRPVAEAIFAFDAIVQNPDRRDGNPNCLVAGDRLLIFDHELCFDTTILLGWKPPWHLGALRSLESPGAHIFRRGLKTKVTDVAHVREAWLRVTDSHLMNFKSAVPREWNATAKVDAALDLVRNARENIDGCLAEILRVLK